MTNMEDVAAVQAWLAKQPHLPNEVDENLIRRFLSVTGGSLERTKATMDLFFCLRADAPEFFSNRDPCHPKMRDMFQVIDLLPLPELTPEGYKCFLYRLSPNNTDPEGFLFNDALKAFFIVGDARIYTETEFPKGEVIIFDMNKFTFKHLTKLVLPSLKKYMQYTQEAHPVRLRQIHIINASPILDKAMMLVKPLMKAEVAKLLHFHVPNAKTFEEFVPKAVMPTDYGGKAGSVQEIKECWMAKIEKLRDWFVENPWMADNLKRQDCKSGAQSMVGSFRTLAID